MMSNQNRELTSKEKRSIKKLVTRLCANYDSEYGCLPLDCDCPMFGICYTNSAMCRYFRETVLPNDPELQASLESQPIRTCQYCGQKFPADGKRVYCSQQCAESARRQQNAARVRKFRNKRKCGLSMKIYRKSRSRKWSVKIPPRKTDRNGNLWYTVKTAAGI